MSAAECELHVVIARLSSGQLIASFIIFTRKGIREFGKEELGLRKDKSDGGALVKKNGDESDGSEVKKTPPIESSGRELHEADGQCGDNEGPAG